MKTIIYKILVLMLGAIFAVCGDGKSGLGNSGEDKVELVGNISLDISVAGAAVLAQDADGNQLASGTSDANGGYSLEMDDNTTGPIVIISEIDGVTLINTITGNFSLAKPGAEGIARGIKGRYRRNVNRLTTYVNKRVLGENLEDIKTTDESTFNTEADTVIDASIGGGLSYSQFSEVESQARVDGDDSVQATAEALIVETIEERAEEAGDFDSIMDTPDTAVSCASSAVQADPPAFLESDAFNGQLTGKFMLSGYSATETESSMAALVGDTSAILDTLKQLTVMIENFTAMVTANSAVIGGVGELKLALDGLVSAVTSVIDQATCSTGSQVAFTGNQLGNLAENVTDIAGEAVISAVANNANSDADFQEEMLEYIGQQAADSIIAAAGGDASDLTNTIDDSTQAGYASTVQSDVDSDVSTVESAGDTIFEDLNGASSALAITFGGSNDADEVTEDLSLPTSGENGTGVSWASSDTGVVATDGTVTQPIGDDEVIVLTATISKNGISIEKDFIVNVIGVEVPSGTELTFGTANGILAGHADNSNYAESMAIDGDGNVYVIGTDHYADTSNNIGFAHKYDSDGNEITAGSWPMSLGPTGYNDQRATFVIIRPSNDNVIIASSENNGGTFYHDAFVREFDSTGTEQWEYVFRDCVCAGAEYTDAMALDANGDIVIAGTSYNSGYYAYLQTIDQTDGSQKAGGFALNYQGSSQATYNRGGLVIDNGSVYTGTHGYEGSFSRWWLKKYNESTTVEDTVNWDFNTPEGTHDFSYIYGGAADSSGNIYFVGTGNADSDARAEKFASDGTRETTDWPLFLNNGGFDIFTGITIVDDYIFVYGRSNDAVSGSSGVDGYWAKYDTDGNLQYEVTYDNANYVEDIKEDNDGNILVLIATYNDIDGDSDYDYRIRKYKP